MIYLLPSETDEGIHDGHGLGGHSGVGVHLLQHLVDGLGFHAPLVALGLTGLLGSLSGGLGSHGVAVVKLAT